MQLFSAIENAAIQESPESIQTTAEDVLELPLLPPEDVATPSNHKLSDQSTHTIHQKMSPLLELPPHAPNRWP